MPVSNLRQLQFAIVGIVLLTTATRLPALLHPQPIDDEGVYSIVANELVDGGRLFVDVVERKPPLLFWTYAAVFKAAGKSNWKALHAAALVWTLCTMAGLYLIGSCLFDRGTGLIAALLYSVFQPWGTFKNLAFNGELLMNLPLVWAWAIAFRRGSSRWRPELLAAGALLCAGFLLKQPAAIAAVPIGAYLLLPSYRTSRGATRTESLTHAALLTIGFFATLGLVVRVLQQQGILHEAFYWVITNHTDLAVFWQRGALHTLAFVAACLPLLIGAAMAIRDDRFLWANKSAERTALLALVGASAVGTAAGARFYPHYYIQLIPPLALLAAPYYARLWSARTSSLHWLRRPWVICAWLGLTVVAFSIVHWIELASEREGSEAGRYISEHSNPNDRIFVWGHKPKVYLSSQRRPASRYIVTFPLTGSLYAGPRKVNTCNLIDADAWATLEEDFRRHPPAFIVDLQSNPG
ncbi:MAG TPA: glycosyltransferase family 39 protein, partial [Chthoniobacterales bacterium]|nr:glycosyltransferase family 39 protein [Chthoniobacterales bacterium]